MDPKLDIFLKWMQNENFFISPSIAIVFDLSCNYCVTANKKIKSGDILVKIPRSSILSVSNSPLYQKLQNDNILHQSKWASLILCILHELFLDSNSHWRDYLRLFPNFKDMTLPMFWNDDDKSLIKYTELELAIERDKIGIEKDYIDIIEPFVKKYPDMFGDSVTRDKYKHCVAFVMAYSFTECDDWPYMVPMADVLNHRSPNNACLVFETSSLTVVAATDISEGEEVYNTYGELSNEELLHMYGFTLSLENNCHDFVELDWLDLNESDTTADYVAKIDKISKYESEWMPVIIEQNGFSNVEEIASVLIVFSVANINLKSWCRKTLPIKSLSNVENKMEMIANNLRSFETVKKIPSKCRNILTVLISKSLKMKKNAVKDIKSRNPQFLTMSPSGFVLQLLNNHIQILEKFLKVVK